MSQISYKDFRPGRTIVFQNSEDEETYVDVITCLVLEWKKRKGWEVMEILTKLYPEMPGHGTILPGDVLELVDLDPFEQVEVNPPIEPPVYLAERIKFDAGRGPEEGHVDRIEWTIEDSGRKSFAYWIAQYPDREPIQGDWLLA